MAVEIGPGKRQVFFHFPAFVDEIVPTTISFSVSRIVADDEWINSAALAAWRDAAPELKPFADPIPEEDFPSWFEVNLLRHGRSPSEYNGPSDDVAIRFGIARIGIEDVLVFDTSASDSYRRNTFADLDLLADWGLLNGQRNHLVVRFVHGRGGDYFAGDIVGWLFSQGVDVAVELARDFLIFRLISPLFGHIRNGRRDRKARKIAARWAARGIEHPAQLREFIDAKDSWDLDELSKRLKISKEASRQLLKALGLQEDSTHMWRPGTSKRARRRRRRWEGNERSASFGPMENDE